MELDDKLTPIDEVLNAFDGKNSKLTPEEKEVARGISEDSSSVTKSSLIGLLSSKLARVSAFDETANDVLKKILERADEMDNNELIALFGTLTRVSASEAKTILDTFKKPDANVQKLIIELQGGDPNAKAIEGKVSDDPLINIRPEMADKMLRLMDKFTKEGGSIKDIKAEKSDPKDEDEEE